MNEVPTETSLDIRQRAEKIARLGGVMDSKPLSLAEAHKQLHKLLVCQIELELQNEELVQNQVEMESALALYDMAPIGYLILNEKGVIQEANITASVLLGIARNVFRKMLISKFIFHDDTNDFDFYYTRLVTSGELQNWEMRMVRIDGSQFWVSVQAALLLNGNFGVTLTDISERKQMEDQLRESEDRYRSLFNVSAEAILLTAPDGKILRANPATCRMFERTEEEIRQIGRSGLVDTSDPRLKLAIEDRNKTGNLSNVELTGIRKNGEKFPADVSSSIFTDKEGNARTSMIIRDITERKLLEEALQNNNDRLQELVAEKTSQLSNTLAHLAKSERFKHTIIDSLPANIVVIDKNGMILSSNTHWMQFGKENSISDETCISVGADYLAACRKASSPDEPGFEAALSALRGITSVLEGRETSFTMDYPCHSPTKNRWYRMTVNWPDTEFEGAVIAHTDISALKQLEEEQHTYTSHLVEAIERERTRTARELHDSLGQSLTLISFTINELKRDNSHHDINQQNLLDIQTGVVSMMESIRRICADLRPALLDELGLSEALEWQCKDFTRRSGIPCSFTFDGDCCDDNRECQMTIFRIVQESQNNTIKHAAASKASFSLYKKDGFVYVEFIDDGVGFTTQKSSGDRSFGIIGMRERAKALGATFEIISSKGKGTSVKLVIPCKRQEGTDALSHS
jgi:PAS domain S-box-containing protein